MNENGNENRNEKCSLLLFDAFGACSHLQSVPFCCSSNAFGCFFWLFIARFGFSVRFHLNIALLVWLFVGMENQNEQQRAKKVQLQMETRLERDGVGMDFNRLDYGVRKN